MASHVQFDKISMKNMRPNKNVFFVGSGSEKTELLLDYISHNKEEFLTGNVVSSAVDTFLSTAPKFLIYDKFDEKIVSHLLKRQKIIAKRDESGFAQNISSPYNIFFAIDDCENAESLLKNESVLELFFNGRHCGITFAMCVRRPKGIIPDMRTNIDYVFLCAASNEEQLEYFTYFCGFFNDFKQFQTIFTELTKDGGCMVIDNRVISQNPKDRIFHYSSHADIN